MKGTEIFKIDASWAEKLTKTRVSFLMTPTVYDRVAYSELISLISAIMVKVIKILLFFTGDGWLKPGHGLGTPLAAKALHHDDVVALIGAPLDTLSIKCTIKSLYKSRKSLKIHQEVRSIHERLRSVEAKVDGKLDKLLENRKITKPRCPICFEKMTASTKIAQCINGHHLCWGCKERLEKKVCPSCAKPVNGRAFGMESYLRTIFAGTQ